MPAGQNGRTFDVDAYETVGNLTSFFTTRAIRREGGAVRGKRELMTTLFAVIDFLHVWESVSVCYSRM